MKSIIETNNLTKKFGNQNALDNVNISVNKGDIYGLVGRNGAGKTTFMKLISGLSFPTAGEISLLGVSSKSGGSLPFSKIGSLIETPSFFTNMSARDNLKLKCICCGIEDSDKYIVSLLDVVDLGNVNNKKVRNFSLGMKQRLGLAMALIGEPDLLILDEPINGLDPQGIAEMRKLILKINHEKDVTIIISSHILSELSKVATRYGILEQGKLIYENSCEELERECAAQNLSLEDFYFRITGVEGN